MDPKKYPVRDFLWSQKDPRWANKKMGKSPATVERFGCASLGVCYIANRFFKDKKMPKLYPNQVIDQCTYDAKGNIWWNSMDKITKGKVVHTYNKDEADYTMMMVWYAGQTHWLVLLNGDLCYDPLKNGSACIKKRVQDYWTENAGFVYFKKV